jgi:hypothetical protein
MTTGPISPTSTSFEAMLEDLLAYAQTKPNGASWQDFFNTSDGQIVAEWIAGLGTFRAYQEFMRMRENNLDLAQLETSVFNLAFAKGLLIPPAQGAEITLNITTSALRSIDAGDYVANVGKYEVYSLESKTVNGNATLRCVVGHLEEFTQTVPGLKKNQAFRYDVTNRYIASQLERWTADGEEVRLSADMDYTNSVTNDFVLRRTLPGSIRIYTGNGTLGWLVPNATTIVYKVLTYAQDITQSLLETPRMLFACLLNSHAVSLAPSFDPDKETVREIARYYPPDGRIVTDNDYAAQIRRSFGGVLEDVFSYNTDPDQHVYLLKTNDFGTGAQESDYVARITRLVDSKRAQGMPVYYHYLARAEGKIFGTSLKIPVTQYTNELVDAANAYLAAKCFKFMRKGVTISTANLATELSAKYGVQFYANATDTLTLGQTDFLKSFFINVTSFLE